jgi:hypothetical protein
VDGMPEISQNTLVVIVTTTALGGAISGLLIGTLWRLVRRKAEPSKRRGISSKLARSDETRPELDGPDRTSGGHGPASD